MIAIDAFGSVGVGVATGAITFLILIFGEITPKSYFYQKNEEMSLLVARPIYVLSVILYPIIIFIEAISNGLLRILGLGTLKDDITEEEIMAAITLGKEAGVLEREEERMMHNVIEFGDMTIKEVMTPKKRIVSLKSDDNLMHALTRMLETRYSRMPIYAEGTNKIMGILNLRNALHHIKTQDFNTPLVQMLSPVIYVHEDDKLDNTMDKLRENASHMAIVRNKKGNITGVVTMEDLLEEIVGEIYDEADKRRHRIHFIDPKTAIIRGDTLVKDLRDVIGIPLKSKAATISELVSARFDNNPKKGQSIEMKNFIISVMNVNKKDPSVINRIKVTKRRGKIRK
jgi:CBS domain containing-hemolysin-like protein